MLLAVQQDTGSYGAQIPGSTSANIITKSFSTVGYNTIKVIYDRRTSNTAATLVADWSTDGSTWTTMETTTSTTWATTTYNCPAGANNNAGFRIRFRTTAGASNRYAYIDNVKISGTSDLPGTASSPTPATGATNVSITQDLSWVAGSGAAMRDVYFGTVTPPVTKVISDAQF